MSTDLPTPKSEPFIPPEQEDDVPQRESTELGDDEDLPSRPEVGTEIDNEDVDDGGMEKRSEGWGIHEQAMP